MTLQSAGTISILDIRDEVVAGGGSAVVPTGGIGLDWVQVWTRPDHRAPPFYVPINCGPGDCTSVVYSNVNLQWYYSFAFYNNDVINSNCNNADCTETAGSDCGNAPGPNCYNTPLVVGTDYTVTPDSQSWLQPNCNCACTFNCFTHAYTTNCNCDCPWICNCACW